MISASACCACWRAIKINRLCCPFCDVSSPDADIHESFMKQQTSPFGASERVRKTDSCDRRSKNADSSLRRPARQTDRQTCQINNVVAAPGLTRRAEVRSVATGNCCAISQISTVSVSRAIHGALMLRRHHNQTLGDLENCASSLLFSTRNSG